MKLAQLNAESGMHERHDARRTAHLMIAIDTLTECWNGAYETTEFLTELRHTANRLNTLADAIEKTPNSTHKQVGTQKGPE